ncbi:hypothetical protein KP79_PYT21989 [Mizuhopecten yessoensis]|uniref:Uncharacterized protein n=1 Tax=Mizuhopecten yessoensis TaxID=6573 RepID=A0A210QES2_MIZYE|nr:hypothetical protein KP79_PYT21989 [Mizuhopecten yessoensis]
MSSSGLNIYTHISSNTGRPIDRPSGFFFRVEYCIVFIVLPILKSGHVGSGFPYRSLLISLRQRSTSEIYRFLTPPPHCHTCVHTDIHENARTARRAGG